ncbi:natural cytotoxicity triggering receptor 3 [Pseudophryne corroboree]|uniref:natural cytotoxicity triggering receptor 3 n=1 Tax=Pseudophryne corroboree TaxID=495146 RepID=UPI0030816A0B
MRSVAGLLLMLEGLQEFLCQTIHVSQIPAILTAEGSSVTLPCTYSISGAENATSGSYRWYRHMVRTGPKVSDSNEHFTGRLSRAKATEFYMKRSASITLHGADVSDTGVYFCEVTFQHNREISGHGAGTLLNVTSLNVTEHQIVGSRCFAHGYHSQTITVSQIPVIVTPEGSSVTLPCTYSISGADNATDGWYRWYRHTVRTGPDVTDSNKDFTGRISRVDGEEFISSRSASITLHRADVSDTGMYYCEVTFQHGGEISGHGAGTFLNVTGKKR